MRITFITTNKHKFVEVSQLLRGYQIELEHLDQSYEENHDTSLEEIARNAAYTMACALRQPVVLEDTGLFFEAYDGFPGALPKFVFATLGYQGIFKLLEGESRNAYFKTVAGFCMPNGKPILFEGILRGMIAKNVHEANKDVMPYDRIFIPEGASRVIAQFSIAEKNIFSQRAKAFTKFGQYIAENYA